MLIGIALILFGPAMDNLYSIFLSQITYMMAGSFPAFPDLRSYPYDDWHEHVAIWPFYIPGITVTMIGLVLVITKRNSS